MEELDAPAVEGGKLVRCSCHREWVPAPQLDRNNRCHWSPSYEENP